MKKWISVWAALTVLVCTLAGCGGEKNQRISIVTTIFPEYDWVTQILGEKADRAEVTMLLDNGVDLHSYQPTATDMVRISACDLFICVGGESDAWTADALANPKNEGRKVLNLLDALGEDAREEEHKEGMQAEEEEQEEETEYDEHVWLSLRNAAKLCSRIADTLGEIDSENKEIYTKNAHAYIEKLEALDARYQKAVGDAAVKTLVFADRFPFRYLTDDYGLDYYAAFAGCSAESEASFETVVFLAGKLDGLGLKAILQIESADGRIAKTVKETTKTKNQTVLTLNSMQSVTSRDVKNGVTYLSVMENNLEILKRALR